MWLNCIKVRALSANEGSGACAWLLAGPVLACFPRDEDILPTAARLLRGGISSFKLLHEPGGGRRAGLERA